MICYKEKTKDEKATQSHKKVIFDWLQEPYIVEFWDNSQEHKDDIINFIYEKQSCYFDGTFQYFVGFIKNEPYSFIESTLIVLQTHFLSIRMRLIQELNTFMQKPAS